jgi:xylulose-5-phosphate/fructose-6-phosphate phosphoketolase
VGARKPDAAPYPDTQLPLNFSCGGARTHNGFSHKDPGFIDYVCNRKSDVVRVYLPPDANCLLFVTDHCLRSWNRINVIVAGKQPEPQWLDMDQAPERSRNGSGR